ncbi:MAG TPA: BatA domain-containing protein [Gemmatimonadaceae bacterium]
MLSVLAPWFLAGLAALGVPVLVHLVHRERKEVVHFPSLMFLERIPYQAVRRQRIRHWLLFLLRCLALAFLAIAFARPFLARRGAQLGAALGEARDIVILLDRSYSMEYGDRWRRAVTAARGVVQRMSGDDRGAVVYFDGAASAAGDLTSDKATLLAAIDSVRPTAGATRYDAAFRLAGSILGDTARTRREVVLISDYQRSGWGGRELPSLPAGATLTQVNLGDSVTANVAVTHVEVRHPASDAAQRVVIAARLANRSAEAVAGRSVALEVNGRRMQTRTVDIPADGAATVQFDELAIPEGVSRGTVRAGADALERDNVMHFALTRAQSLPVLLVESPNDGATAGLFVTRALSIGNRPFFRVKEVTSGQLTGAALRGTALVILDGVPMPQGELGRRLVEYVRGGGGLLVAMSGRSRPDDWPVIADELLPRPTAPPIDRLADHGATLGFLDRAHPVFDPFNAPRSGDFSAARFFRYWTVTPAPGDRQLARFDDGRVALLERRVGAGRVLAWSSGLDGIWNDLPLQPVFLPFLHQAAKYAAGYKEERPWAVVGEVVSIPASGAPSVAVTPSGGRVGLGTAGAPASLTLSEQGFYEIQRTGGAGNAPRVLAVNVDLAESDLTPLDAELLATAVAPRAADHGDGESAMDEEGETGAAELTPSVVERRQGVWWYLLAVALLLLGTETLLSNRLSRAAR